MQPCFSIIIPVYNVATYLEQCVHSILKAVMPIDEIILVCGNSSDRSNELSRSLEEKYENVHVIMQNGEGPSNARNCGLKRAKGEFILFSDGDDYIDSFALHKLLSDIRSGKCDFDILITDFYRYYQRIEKAVLIQQFDKWDLSGLDQIMASLHHRECFWNIWRYIYRRAFLLQNNIWFWENAYAEDLDFTINVFTKDPMTCYVPTAYYYYRIGREGSLMNCTPVKRVISTLAVIEKDIRLLKETKASWKQKMISQLQFEYILNLALICELPKERQEQVARVVRVDILNPTYDPTVKTIEIILRVMGVRMTAYFLSILKRFKRKREGRVLQQGE